MLVNADPNSEVDLLLANAKEQAFRDGYAQGQLDKQAQEFDTSVVECEKVLTSVQAQIDTLLDQADAHQKQVEDQTLEFISSVANLIWPKFKAKHSIECAVENLKQILQKIRGVPSLSIRMAPDAVEYLAVENINLAREMPASTEIEMLADESLSTGDVRISWENGGAEYSLDAVCTEVLDAITSAMSADKQQGKLDNDKR